MPTTAPVAAKPSKSIFDPFNSSATGHQRAENRLSGSTSWRESRSLKLNAQYTGGLGGGKRISDTVGAGSLDFGQDGRTENGGWMKGAKGLRRDGQQSLWESTGGVKVEKNVERPTKRGKVEGAQEKPTKVVNPWTPFRREDGEIRESSWTSHELSPSHLLSPINPSSFASPSAVRLSGEGDSKPEVVNETPPPPGDPPPPQIFNRLNFYINGSTAPTISDHKLKFIIAEHGGNHSISLGRRTVTHVIIARPSSSGGCGGGLAGSKLHKEITKQRGEKVKFMTVDWILESVKAGKRLPERNFEAVRMAPKGVGNVASMFSGAQSVNKSQAQGDESG
jgi:hypothetical protein